MLTSREVRDAKLPCETAAPRGRRVAAARRPKTGDVGAQKKEKEAASRRRVTRDTRGARRLPPRVDLLRISRGERSGSERWAGRAQYYVRISKYVARILSFVEKNEEKNTQGISPFLPPTRILARSRFAPVIKSIRLAENPYARRFPRGVLRGKGRRGRGRGRRRRRRGADSHGRISTFRTRSR